MPYQSDAKGEIYMLKKLLVFESNGNRGLRTFDGEVLIDPIYTSIEGINNILITAIIGERPNRLMDLMNFTGEVILPIEYNDISWLDDGYILCEEDNGYEMLRLVVKSGQSDK